MHGYPVMQLLQYSMPPSSCSWMPQQNPHRGLVREGHAGYPLS